MGGGGSAPEIPNISVKSLGQLTSEAVSSVADAAPRLAEVYAGVSPSISNTLAKSQQILAQGAQQAYPILQPLQEFATNRLKGAMTTGIPQELTEPFLRNLRASQSMRGIAESPIAAIDESRYLTEMGEEYKRNTFTDAMNLASTQGQLTLNPLSPADLNLVSPSASELVSMGPELENTRVNLELQLAAARQAQYNAEKQRKAAMGKSIGTAVGATAAIVAAPFTGGASLAFLPALTAGGGALGQTAGGTFF